MANKMRSPFTAGVHELPVCPECGLDILVPELHAQSQEHLAACATTRPPRPPAPRTCEQCAYWRHTHHDMPARWQLTGNHGMCVSPCQPNHVEHKNSAACAWFASADAPPAPPADGRRCPNFGKHLSDEFNGCADCGVKVECYAAWERAQARAEVEPTKEELFEKALSFGEIPEITLRDKSTGWLRAYIEVYLNEQWRANGKKSRALVRPQWRGI